jgi:serine/threonine protein phosphatase PrpC
MSLGISRDATTASLSHVGRVREMNQDVCGEFSNDTHRLLVVADGMGGHSGGETASRLALEAIGETFHAGFDDAEEMLTRAFLEANVRIYTMGSQEPALHGMGTTGVALLLGPDRRAWIAHVGDSRGYQMHGGQLRQVTEDHSWVYQEMRNRRITPAEAETHPMKNVLLRSIGVSDNVDVTTSPLDVQPGDRFLLCSDGLWGEVVSESIADILGSEEPESAVQMLVDLANDCGGSDNVTVQIAAIDGEPDASSSDATLPTELADTEPITDVTASLDVTHTLEVEANEAAGGSRSWPRLLSYTVGALLVAIVVGRSACS